MGVDEMESGVCMEDMIAGVVEDTALDRGRW